jgi:hypothetical protein
MKLPLTAGCKEVAAQAENCKTTFQAGGNRHRDAMMKLLYRRLLRVVMITPLGWTRQVYDRYERFGFAHDSGKTPTGREPINARRIDSDNMQW